MSSRESVVGAASSRATADTQAAAQAPLRISLLTGADDRSYALGLATSLMARGLHLDFIGSDEVDGPELHSTPAVRFLNLRGDQSPGAGLACKIWRILRYYARLIAYAARSHAPIFHILWNNKFLHFDRTLLMLYYRALGRRVVLTAHNVNAERRDGRDTWLNRFTLRMQYRMCDQIFVHTPRMAKELVEQFSIAPQRVTVIPFGINNTSPDTAIDGPGARRRLGLSPDDRVLLFFGQIAPYKGLEHLVQALPCLCAEEPRFRLVIAGKVKAGSEAYWRSIEDRLRSTTIASRVVQRIEHIPDADVELYFKAADALAIPYVHIFQSGVPFLAYSFGLPVIATDVGSLRDDIVEGRTGLLCKPADPEDFARAVRAYFTGPLYADIDETRRAIREFANERYSWSKVASITDAVYRRAVVSRRHA